MGAQSDGLLSRGMVWVLITGRQEKECSSLVFSFCLFCWVPMMLDAASFVAQCTNCPLEFLSSLFLPFFTLL